MTFIISTKTVEGTITFTPLILPLLLRVAALEVVKSGIDFKGRANKFH